MDRNSHIDQCDDHNDSFNYYLHNHKHCTNLSQRRIFRRSYFPFLWCEPRSSSAAAAHMASRNFHGYAIDLRHKCDAIIALDASICFSEFKTGERCLVNEMNDLLTKSSDKHLNWSRENKNISKIKNSLENEFGKNCRGVVGLSRVFLHLGGTRRFQVLRLSWVYKEFPP